MHSPLRRQLAAARTPSRTPRRLKQDAPQLQPPIQQPQWNDPEQSSRIHLTPRRAAPNVQRAWERKPRAGQKGKTVWKRPQRAQSLAHLRAEPSVDDSGPLTDKTNVTPRKVVKKARISAESKTPFVSKDAVAKPMNWDRRSSLLPHKTRSSALDEDDKENHERQTSFILPAKLAADATQSNLEERDGQYSELSDRQNISASCDKALVRTGEAGRDVHHGLSHPESPDHLQADGIFLAPDVSILGGAPANNAQLVLPEHLSVASQLLDPKDSETGTTTMTLKSSESNSDENRERKSAQQLEDETLEANASMLDQITSQSAIMEDQHLLTNLDEFAPSVDSTILQTPSKDNKSQEENEPLSPIGLDLQSLIQPSVIEPREVENSDQGIDCSTTNGEDQNSNGSKDSPTPVSPIISPNPETPERDQVDDTISFQSPTSPTVTQDAPLTPGSTTTKIALNDDESVLHAFLSRANASKAARIAKRSSDSNKRDSDIVKTALASPAVKVKEIAANESPSESKNGSLELDGDQTEDLLASPNISHGSVGDSSKRQGSAENRSRRKRRRPVHQEHSEDEAAEEQSRQASGPVTFALRRRGEDGNDRFALKRTEAHEWSMMTRSNTRRNKAGALPVRAVLMRLRGGDISPEDAAAMYAGEGAIPDGSERSKVKWNEQLVKFFEESAAGNRGLDEDVVALNQLSAQASDTSRPRVRRAKALGAMNGTPAKSRAGKVVLDDGKGPSAEDEEGTAGQNQSTLSSKQPATKSTPGGTAEDNDTLQAIVAENETLEVAEPPKKQSRRLPAPAVRSSRAGTIQEQSKTAGTSLPIPKTRSAAAAVPGPSAADQKTSSLRSALPAPARRSARSRQ